MRRLSVIEHQRSWLLLVTFCAVTVLIVALGSAVPLGGASVALAVARPSQVEEVSANEITPVQPAVMQPVDDGGAASSKTFVGMITDSRCAARHRTTLGKSPAECVRSCVRNGAHYVLVDGERIYALEGDPAQLGELAGERVSLVGMIEGNAIKVKAVAAG